MSPRQPKAKARVTTRKYMGDDGASWAVFVDGKPFVTGLTKSEVPYYRRQAWQKIDPRAWLHLCKDGTISIRRAGEPVFNGKALPVLECANEQEAKDVQVLTCKLQKVPHPDMAPGQPWFTIGSGPFAQGFSGEYEDIARVEEYLREMLLRVRARATNHREAP